MAMRINASARLSTLPCENNLDIEYSALHCHLHTDVSRMCLYVLHHDLHKSGSNRPLTILRNHMACQTNMSSLKTFLSIHHHCSASRLSLPLCFHPSRGLHSSRSLWTKSEEHQGYATNSGRQAAFLWGLLPFSTP